VLGFRGFNLSLRVGLSRLVAPRQLLGVCVELDMTVSLSIINSALLKVALNLRNMKSNESVVYSAGCVTHDVYTRMRKVIGSNLE
jgi:hypothetical protein